MKKQLDIKTLKTVAGGTGKGGFGVGVGVSVGVSVGKSGGKGHGKGYGC